MSVHPSVRDLEELQGDEALDHTCSICGATLSTERAFRLHQKVDHDKSHPFI
jgi:hypothetical protein